MFTKVRPHQINWSVNRDIQPKKYPLSAQKSFNNHVVILITKKNKQICDSIELCSVFLSFLREDESNTGLSLLAKLNLNRTDVQYICNSIKKKTIPCIYFQIDCYNNFNINLNKCFRARFIFVNGFIIV